MSYRIACFLFSVVAACVAHPATSATDKPEAGVGDSLVPPGAETLCLTFDASTLPAWRVQNSRGDMEVARQIRVVQGRPVQILMRGDRECRVEIPAMRVRTVVIPDRYQSAWFQPCEPGEYEILVRSGAEQFDGKVVVVAGDKTR
jgi:heme/copper-type cytochrome/quinol oxidase subunit 2